MRRARRILTLLCAVLAGCSIYHETVGTELPVDLSTLVRDRTTKAEALAVLGAPDLVRRQYDGDLLVWIQDDNWSRRLLLVPLLPLYEQTRGEARRDMVSLLFDERGILRGIGVQRGIPAGDD